MINELKNKAMKNLTELEKQISEVELDIQFHKSMIDSSMAPSIKEIIEHESEIEHLKGKLKRLIK